MIDVGKFLHRICESRDITKFRGINREWRQCVNNIVSRMNTLSLTYSVCLELLQYDKTIYDENYYKRMIISQRLTANLDKYFQIRLPRLSVYDIDIDDLETTKNLVKIVNGKLSRCI